MGKLLPKRYTVVMRKKLTKVEIKAFLLIFGFDLIGVITLLLNHYMISDDMRRAIYGSTWNSDFGRYSSSLLAQLLHQNVKLFDMSPIPQVVAMAIMAVSSMMLVYLFVGRIKSIRESFWPLLIAALFGLCPFMMNAWRYKFDAPCMALGIAVSILPYYLYWGEIKVGTSDNLPGRIAITMACIAVMWTSFQAASGIFLIVGLALMVRDSIKGREQSVFQAIVFLFCHLVVSLLFFLLVKDGIYYRNIIIGSVDDIWSNICGICKMLTSSTSAYWAIMIGVIIICSFVMSLKRGDELYYLALMVGFLSVGVFIAVGPLLLLKDFPYVGRSLVGVCCLFVVFLLLLWSSIPKRKYRRIEKVYYVALILVFYGFLTYGWSFGNALSGQYEYDNNLATMIMGDLTDIVRTEDEARDTIVLVDGVASPAPVMAKHLKAFPVARYNYMPSEGSISIYVRDRLFDQNNYPNDWRQDIVCGDGERFCYDMNICDGEAELLYPTLYYDIARIRDATINGKKVYCIMINEKIGLPVNNDLEWRANPYEP